MDKLVRDLMKIGVPVCTREARLPEVAKIMARENADAVIVMDELGACGVVSQSDLVHAYPRNYELLKAEEVMTPKIISIVPDAAATAAAHLMRDEKVHQVFVMHEHPRTLSPLLTRNVGEAIEKGESVRPETGRPSAVVTMRAIVREMAGLPPERPEVPKKTIARKK